MPPAGLSLLQWNIGNFDVRLRLPGRGPDGMSYSHGTASRDEDLAGHAAVIRAEAPDLVTLQEVVVSKDHHRRLAQLTGYVLAASGTHDARHTEVVLVKPGVELLGPLKAPSRIAGVGARVRIQGRELAVYSNHSEAGVRTRERVAQHRALAAWAREVSRSAPLMIGGDFNFDDTPGSLHERAQRLRPFLPFVANLVSSDWDADRAALSEMKAAMNDLGADAGATSGAPRLWPRILLPLGFALIPLGWALGAPRHRSRLDYVLGSGSICGLGCRVIRLIGANAAGHPAAAPGAFPWMDHDPVLVRFAIEAT